MAAEAAGRAGPGGRPCRPDWIAVDGPAGAGKSTLARALARCLGYRYVDSGATYRAAALAVLRAGLRPEEEAHWPAIVELVGRCRIQLDTSAADGGSTRVWLDGEEVTQAIRSPQVSQAASSVARIPGVRARLARLQRELAEQGPCVMDGRDIGTVVLPDACVKLFVTASLAERARRRALELAGPDAPQALVARLARELESRDLQDSTRSVAPLVAAADAQVVDTTWLTVEQALEQALAAVRRRLGREGPRCTGSPGGSSDPS
ncbi:MAG TPA: (d)CMP kinase [Limnochordales bacterium]